MKVVVSLHNDHARYCRWGTPSGPVRAAGGLLRERLGDAVFSIGFFMGGGSVANNSRQVRVMPDAVGELERRLSHDLPSIGALLLPRDSTWVRPMSYLRNGLVLDSLAPAHEFDALIFVDRVSPPTYISIP